MSNVFAVLEEKGLVTGEQVESAFRSWSPKEAEEIRDSLWTALLADKKEVDEPASDLTAGEFRFFASSSIRGDFGCDEWGCRATKAANLARYAALYCETVIVPVRMNLHTDSKHNPFVFKNELAGTILCLQQLRQASESGILRLVPDSLFLCPECAKEAGERFTSSVQAAQDFMLKNTDKFSVEYLPKDSEIPVVRLEVKGPEEYLEHGRVIMVFFETPEWLRNLGTGGVPESGYKFSPIEIEKTGVIASLLSNLVGDAGIQQYYGAYYGAKCLTNLPAQAHVLNTLNDDDFMAQCTSGLLANIAHSVPLLNELPTAVVARIRKEEPDAFIRYRAALGKIVKEYVKAKKNVGATEAKEIYSDLLLPEILRLRAQAKDFRKSKVAAAVKKCTFSAVAVTVGLFGGLPAQIASVLKVAGGSSLLRDLRDAVFDGDGARSEVRNDNFYFLLRVLDETE